MHASGGGGVIARRVARLVFGAGLCVAAGCGGTNGAAALDNGSGTAGPTLAAIRSRGNVMCGITQGAGFATPDDSGRWRGFDVDFCRALAVAVLGDENKVRFVPFTQQQRFSGLQSGEVDVLVNGTSVTISRAMGRHFHFGPVYLYDGQGFLARKASKVTSATALNGATVCVQQGTTTELNLSDFARRNHIAVRPVVIEDLRGAVSALASGRCDVITQDGAGLATTRTMLRDPQDYIVLPERISKEPIAPVVRFGDDQWLEVVNWVFRAPIEAEELGIDKENLSQFARSTDPAVRRFLGLEPGITDGFGLDAQWPSRVIAALGNYGEIFERNLGDKTPLGMDRGPNRPWTSGGLLYSPPFR
jgi:general L-amino acid transport system substrate-binding protein